MKMTAKTKKMIESRQRALLEKIKPHQDQLDRIEKAIDFAIFMQSHQLWNKALDQLEEFGNSLGLTELEKSDLFRYEYAKQRKEKGA